MSTPPDDRREPPRPLVQGPSSDPSGIGGWSGVSIERACARHSRRKSSNHCIWLTFDREKKWTGSESNSAPRRQKEVPFSAYSSPTPSWAAASGWTLHLVVNHNCSGSEKWTPIQYLPP